MHPISAAERHALVKFTEAAEAGAQCPTNGQIADELAMTEGHMNDVIKKLIARGLIRVEKVGSSKRVVTIVATGQSTAPTDTSRPRRYGQANRREHNSMSAEAIAERVYADQARIRAAREAHLIAEQRRYDLPKRGRLPEDMAA